MTEDNGTDETPIDLLAIIDAFEPMRESVRGVVAMFRADGFDDDSARALAVTTITGWRFNVDGSS